MNVRIKLIREEADELVAAIQSRKLHKIAREGIDLTYVAIGTFVDFGLPFRRCWRAVQRANMDKVIDPKGGKPIKHTEWKSPDKEIEKIIVGRLLQPKEEHKS